MAAPGRPSHRFSIRCVAVFSTALFSTTRLICRILTWLLLPVLFVFPTPGRAEWQVVERPYLSSDLQTVYVDQATIRREGNLVTLSQLTDFRWMQGNVGFGGLGPHRFFSTITQKQFICAEKRFRLLGFTEFSYHMGAGRPADGYVDADAWLPVEPESINQALWEIACGGT